MDFIKNVFKEQKILNVIGTKGKVKVGLTEVYKIIKINSIINEKKVKYA